MKPKGYLMMVFIGVLAAFSAPVTGTGLQVRHADASGVDVTLSVTDFSLSPLQAEDAGVYQQLRLPGGGLTVDHGKPELPVRSFYVAIPQGAEIRFSYTVSEETMRMDHAIYPSQPAKPETGRYAVAPFKKDEEFYTRNEFYPYSVVEVSPVMVMRGCRMVMVSTFPFAYNPAMQSLKIYRQIDISIDFEGGTGEFIPRRYRSIYFQPFFDAFLINARMLEPADLSCHNRGNAQNTGADLLVVVNDLFFNEIQPLADWRRQTGIETMVVRWSEVGTTAADLRTYVSDAYYQWDLPPSFLLIVGDADHVPVNYLYSHPYHGSLTGTDHWYVAFEGSDYLPELHTGRISVENPGELTTVVNKILEYSRHPYTAENWFDDVLLAACEESGRFFVWGSETIYTYLNANGYTCNRQYEYGTPPGSTQGCIDAINGGVLIANHRDHGDAQNGGGSYTGWSHPNFTTNHIINDLSNGPMYPVMFSINCNSGWFDGETDTYSGNYESIGEVGIRADNKGCVAVVCSTRVSYSGYNDELCRGFYDGMFPDFDPAYPDGSSANPYSTAVYKMSQVLNFGKFWMYDKYIVPGGCPPYSWTPSNDKSRAEFEMFHLHGDPTMEIWTALPTQMNVTHAAACLISQPTFTVNADQEGALAALTFDGEIVGRGYIMGGTAVINIDPPLVVPGTMTVTLTAHNRIPYEGTVEVIPPEGPYVIFYDCRINDAVTGNNNGQWDFGETVELSIEVQNVGIHHAISVNVTIASDDALVSVLDGEEFYGGIPAGQTSSVPDGFQVEVSSAAEDQHVVPFTLTAATAAYAWESYFVLVVNAPKIQMGGVRIDDLTGNNNGALDPGETVDFSLRLVNRGHCDAANVMALLSSGNPLVTISDNPQNYGDLQVSQAERRTFVVSADAGIPSGTWVTLSGDITDTNGYAETLTGDLLVGDERNLPCGPDNYGYRAWDNMDGGESIPYDWIEIAPSAGGPGTVLSLTGDDQTVQVSLPFTFRYYGMEYDQIAVCSNGWLAMGYTSTTDYSNSAIPNSDGPGAMVAAFWDDLTCGYSGTQVCSYFDPVDHRMVIEWYDVAHLGSSGTRETFEVILYDPAYYFTGTDDGIILVQYQTVMDPSSATIGIEDNTETDGIEYGYNGNFDIHAWPVESGRSITYTPNIPTISLAITPQDPPAVVACGESFMFSGTLVNRLDDPQITEAWTVARHEDGTLYDPVEVYPPISLDPQEAVTYDLIQDVRQTAPTGLYDFIAYCGTYPDMVVDSDFFEVTVVDFVNDTGAVSVNSPGGINRPGDYTVNTTVENFGSLDQVNLPVSCTIYNEVNDPVYTAAATTAVQALGQSDVDFSPPWHADIAGTFRIVVTTLLPGDEYPGNDVHELQVFIQEYTDVGVPVINSPTPMAPPGPITVNATIENFGDGDETVLVNCSVYEGGAGGVLLEEHFEDTFPPAGWTITQYSGTGTWQQETYDVDSYDPPGTGDFYAEADDRNFGANTNFDVGFFTPSLFLTGYDDVTLIFERNFQEYVENGWATVNTYSGGMGQDCFEEELLMLNNDDNSSGVHTELSFDPSGYANPSDVYIEFYYNDDSYNTAWEFSIDDVIVTAAWTPDMIADPIYSVDMVVNVSALSTSIAVFSPPWDAEQGIYAVFVTTMLPGDENPANDQKRMSVWVVPETDAGVVSIDYPTGIQRPGDYSVEATAENFGSLDQTAVPVNCTIYDENDNAVYTADTTVDIPAFDQRPVDFLPPWQVVTPGTYRIRATTLLPGDGFPDNDASEITMTIQPYTDVGVTSINSPTSDIYAGSCTVNATIGNFGDTLQDSVPVHCEIAEGVPSIIFQTDFVNLNGWTQEEPPEWAGASSHHAGGAIPEIDLRGDRINGDYAWVQSPAVNTTGVAALTVEFKTYIDHAAGTFDCRLYTRASSIDPWTEILSLTVDQDFGPRTIRADISADAGPETQVRWEFDGSSSNLDAWFLDDLILSGYTSGTGDPVYQDDEMISVAALSTSEVDFSPAWNAAPGIYTLTVSTALPGDENPQNNLQYRAVTVLPVSER